MENEKKIGVGVGVLILKDNKILMGKRHEDKEKADSELHGEGTWTMPGGKLHFQESFEEAAIRETREETGIELKSVRVFCVSNDKVSDAHFVTIGLFSDDFVGEAKVVEPDEITEWNWFSIDNLPEKVFFPSEKMLDKFKLNKFYME